MSAICCTGPPGAGASSTPPPHATTGARRLTPHDMKAWPNYHERGGTPQSAEGQWGFMDWEVLADEAGGAPAAQSPATGIYSLGRDREESARLRQQSAEMRPYSARLLDRTGLAGGQSATGLGCGPRGSIGLLAA